jgi:hypothetical protein
MHKETKSALLHLRPLQSELPEKVRTCHCYTQVTRDIPSITWINRNVIQSLIHDYDANGRKVKDVRFSYSGNIFQIQTLHTIERQMTTTRAGKVKLLGFLMLVRHLLNSNTALN